MKGESDSSSNRASSMPKSLTPEPPLLSEFRSFILPQPQRESRIKRGCIPNFGNELMLVQRKLWVEMAPTLCVSDCKGKLLVIDYCKEGLVESILVRKKHVEDYLSCLVVV